MNNKNNIDVDESDLFITASEDDLAQTTEVEESDTTPVEYSEWQKPEEFTDYIVASARNMPTTYQGSLNSLRRAFAYLENVQTELISGVEQDAPYAELDEDQLRTLDSVEEGIEQSLGQIAHILETGLTKTATKSSNFVYYVNPFIFGLARTLVNGKVSQGKNIEALYGKLNEKYKLTDREKLELHYILNDMGYPITSSPVGHEDRMETYFA